MSSEVGLDSVAFSCTSEDLNELATGTTDAVRLSTALGAANATAARERAVRSLKDIVGKGRWSG